MVENRPARTASRRRPRGTSYVYERNCFVAWCESKDRNSLPATPEDVAAYLDERSEAGPKASTIKVTAAAISHYHREGGLDVPLRQGVARAVLDELTQDSSPGPTGALPLVLDCYLAIRRTAHEPRKGRGGRMERASSAHCRDSLDVAMIGLMQDASLRVSEAAMLVWSALEVVPDGSGPVRVGQSGYRVVSTDTMWLLLLLRQGAGDDEPVLGLQPNQITSRISAAARGAGLGGGYTGDNPRLGTIQDLETLGVLLVGRHIAATPE